MAFIADQNALSLSAEMYEAKRTIVEFGIPLIEVQLRKPSWNTQRDFGAWDVRCKIESQEGFQVVPRTQWFTGNRAYVEYFPNKLGVLTGFLPDDEYWFNRLFLASNYPFGKFRVVRCHLRDGEPVSGPLLSQEIRSIFRHTHIWRVNVRVDRNYETRFESASQDACNEYHAKFTQDNPGVPVAIILGKIEPIRKIIASAGPVEWVKTETWQKLLQKLKEDVAADTKEFRTKEMAAAAPLNIAAQVATMSPDEKREVIRELLGEDLMNRLLGGAGAQMQPGAIPASTALPMMSNLPVANAPNVDAVMEIEHVRSVARKYGIRFGKRSIEEVKRLVCEKAGFDPFADDIGESPQAVPPDADPMVAEPASAPEEVEEEVT